MRILNLLCVTAIALTSVSFADTTPPAPVTGTSWLAAHLSGNYTLTSNYIYQGVSQTKNGPAAQGGIALKLDNGLNFNLWGSSVSFAGTNAYIEFDPSIGYDHAFENGSKYSLYLINYTYPRANFLNYKELDLIGSYEIFSFRIAYSNDYFGSHASGSYWNAGITYPLSTNYFNVSDLTIGGTIGYTQMPSVVGNSYIDYMAFVSKDISKTMKLSLKYTNTNHRYDYYDNAHLALEFTSTF